MASGSKKDSMHNNILKNRHSLETGAGSKASTPINQQALGQTGYSKTEVSESLQIKPAMVAIEQSTKILEDDADIDDE